MRVNAQSQALKACRPRYASRTHEALAGAHLVLDGVDEEEAARWRPVLEMLEAALKADTEAGRIPPRTRVMDGRVVKDGWKR